MVIDLNESEYKFVIEEIENETVGVTKPGAVRLRINNWYYPISTSIVEGTKPSFKLEYNYCYKKECTKSYEYVKPSIVSNYDKVLLKLKGTYNLSDEVNIEGVYDIYDLIDKFGYLKYELNNEVKTQNVKFKEVTSNKAKEMDTYYIEVLKELQNASKISLIIKIRNQTYEYTLK